MATEKVVLKELNLQTLIIPIVGDTPLVQHRWSEKAKKQIRDKQQKKAASAKGARDPEQEFRDAMYTDGNGGYCFPAIALKCAMVDAATQLGRVLTKTFLRGAFFVFGDDKRNEFLKLKSDKPFMREDSVVIGMGTSDLRYRPQFDNWSTEAHVLYNADSISAEQIFNLIDLAGFSNGLGEMRPSQKQGNSFGQFHVARNGEAEK